MTRRLFALALALLLPVLSPAAEKIRVLLIDGQNNHDWKRTSPLITTILKDAGLFEVTVATADKPAEFKPDFSDIDVVVSNYNGPDWPKDTQAALEVFVKKGGGFVSVHAANNSFPGWPEYNKMIALGGWGGRNEKSGPYVRFRDGKPTLVGTPGSGGSHGAQHPFAVETRVADHPVMAGLPTKWMHAQDELYDRLRGPAENLTVLATAYADPQTGGSGEHEPMLMVVDYGKGRVFHTTLGHGEPAMRCTGFAATLARGTEWAATGKVTLPVPADFPTAEKVRTWGK